MKRLRRHTLLLVTAFLVAACGVPAVTIVTRPSPQGGTAGTARIEPARLWVQQGSESGLSSIVVLDTTRRQPPATLPSGVITRDWTRLYTVGQTIAGPTLTVIDTATATRLDTTAVPPGFDLPAFGPSQRPTGLSPSGRFLVLVGGMAAGNAQATKSSFLVYDTAALIHAPLRVDLAGSFSFDGISSDGHNLFLLEDLGQPTTGAGYHVRRYDLVAHALDPRVIADKRTGERIMSGAPTDSVTSQDGAWQFTVYAFGATSPFVHVLNLNDATSFCIDLPRAPNDQALDLLWGLAASHDARFVYAVNAANGAVLEMPVDAAYQTRSGSLPVPTPVAAAAWTPWSPITVVAKRIAYGAAAISPDDRTLYSLGDLGVSAIDTGTLTVRRSLVPAMHLISLTLSPDGLWLYAASADSTAPLLQIDTRNGRWTSIAGSTQPLEVLHVVTRAP
jgi:DNA-binding beta-propeller fold protein YncE